MNNRKILLYTLFFLAGSCSSESVKEGINFVPIDQNLAEISTLVKSYKLILLSNEEGFFSNKIIKIQNVEGKLLVLDRQTFGGRILVFNELGDAVAKIDAMGRGPGEYLQIADFDVDTQKNEVLIADPLNKKVLKFSYLGDHLSSNSVNHWIKSINLLRLENKESIIVTSPQGSHTTEDGDNYDIFIFDEHMNLKSKGLSFTKPHTAGMGNSFNFYETSEGVNYYHVFTDTIYQINRKGQLQIKNTVKFPVDILPSHMIMDHMTGKVELIDYVYFVSYFENEEIVAFTYSWDGRDHIGIYNKAQEQSQVAQIPKLPSCMECVGLNLVGASNKHLISYSTSRTIKELINVIDPKKEKCVNPETLTLIDNINENNNSVVLLLNIK